MKPKLYFKLLDQARKSTPSLVFDRETVLENMKSLHAITEATQVEFLFAVKSFPAPEMIDMASEFLSGFDISNLNETKLLSKSVAHKIISVCDPTGRSISFGSEFAMNDNQLRFVIDGDVPDGFGPDAYPHTVTLLRVNSDDLVGKDSQASRFGFRFDEIREVISKKRVSVEGFHFHVGWQNNDIETILKSIGRIKEFCLEIKFELKYLDCGGGLSSLSRDELFRLARAARELLGPKTQISFEPGRWLTDGAGFAICKTVGIGERQGEPLLKVDLSRSCHLRWDRVKLLTDIENTEGVDKVKISIVGPTCYENDLIGSVSVSRKFLDVVRKTGTALVFSGVSGYSVAWNHDFNGIEKAEVVWI